MADDVRINRRILDGIRECAKGDEVIIHFLDELLFLETEHAGQWWWKDPYTQRIKKYSARWRNNGEN